MSEDQYSMTPPWRFSWPARVAILYTGVLLPIICLSLGFPTFLRDLWKSGDLDVYAKLMLSPRTTPPLWPFLACHMICLVLLVFRPERFARWFVVRLGVYSGVATALVFWAIFAAALDATPVWLWAFYCALGVAIPWGGGFLLLWALRHRITWLIAGPLLAMAGCVVALDLIVALVIWQPPVAVGYAFGFSLVVSFFMSTPWAVTAYFVVSLRVFWLAGSGGDRWRFTLAQLLGVFTWAGAWLGAWRLSYLWMLEQYAALPAEQPESCYVATAAARGHRRLVGAERFFDAAGHAHCVNDQMRRLKAAELLLKRLWPAGHRACRALYDRLGPPLAARLGHPLAADLAYLTLKPAEWLARAVLAAIVPGSGRWIARLYGRAGATCRATAASRVDLTS